MASAAARRARKVTAKIVRDLTEVQKAGRASTVTALNRVGRDVERDGVAQLSTATNHPKGVIRWHRNLDGQRTNKRRFAQWKATRHELEVSFAWLPLRRRPVINFATYKTTQTRKGVRAGKHLLVGAFVPEAGAKRYGPKRGGVYRRQGEARMPIVWQEDDIRDQADQIFGRLVDGSGPDFEREFNRAMSRALKRTSRRTVKRATRSLGRAAASL